MINTSNQVERRSINVALAAALLVGPVLGTSMVATQQGAQAVEVDTTTQTITHNDPVPTAEQITAAISNGTTVDVTIPGFGVVQLSDITAVDVSNLVGGITAKGEVVVAQLSDGVAPTPTPTPSPTTPTQAPEPVEFSVTITDGVAKFTSSLIDFNLGATVTGDIVVDTTTAITEDGGVVGKVDVGDIVTARHTLTNGSTFSVSGLNVHDQGLIRYLASHGVTDLSKLTGDNQLVPTISVSREIPIAQDLIDAGPSGPLGKIGLPLSNIDLGGVKITDGVTGAVDINGEVDLVGANAPALRLTKDVNSDGKAQAGDEVVLDYTVTNNGVVSLTNLRLVATVDGKTLPTDATQGETSLSTLTPGSNVALSSSPTTVTEEQVRAGTISVTGVAAGERVYGGAEVMTQAVSASLELSAVVDEKTPVLTDTEGNVTMVDPTQGGKPDGAVVDTDKSAITDTDKDGATKGDPNKVGPAADDGDPNKGDPNKTGINSGEAGTVGSPGLMLTAGAGALAILGAAATLVYRHRRGLG